MPIFRDYFRKYGTILIFSVVFWGLFISVCIQRWNTYPLLILPLSQYLIFIWLQIEAILKTPLIMGKIKVQFDSLGNTDTISKKFCYCALLELLIIFIMGIEANYHPQLVGSYFVLYIIPIGLLSVFSLYFSMHPLFAQSKIEIQDQNNLTKIHLKKDLQKLMHGILITIIVVESILWIGFSILAYFDIFAFSLSVPGSSEYLSVSYMLFFILFSSVTIPTVLLVYVHFTVLKGYGHSIKNLSQETQKLLQNALQNHLLFPRFLKA